jgi:anti-anti-sigma factor
VIPWDSGPSNDGRNPLPERNVEQQDAKRPAIVVFSGELDFYGVERVRAALEPIAGPVVIDLTDVRLIDASTLTELVRLRKRVGDCVTVVAPSPNVRRVFGIVGFEKLFRIVHHRNDV